MFVLLEAPRQIPNTLGNKALLIMIMIPTIESIFYFYICSFSFLNAPVKYIYCSLPENKTWFILFV